MKRETGMTPTCPHHHVTQNIWTTTNILPITLRQTFQRHLQPLQNNEHPYKENHVFEIIKLVKLSPRRDALFELIRKELGNPNEAGIRFLCITRWTVKAEACISIIKNYSYLIKAFQVHTYLDIKNQMN